MAASAPFIVVTGNIAAGKSTLVERLAVELDLPAYLERVEQNPFFGMPSDRSLESEAWFLTDSVVSHRAISRGRRGGVQERSVYEQIAVFAQARSRLGWLSSEELQLLETLSSLLAEGLELPDLLVYVEADLAVIQGRILARGRPQEQEIDAAYLSLLAELYDGFIDAWRRSPVYRLNSSRLDIREREDFHIVCQEIGEVLHERYR